MFPKGNSAIEVVDAFRFSDGRIMAVLRSPAGRLADGTLLTDDAGNQWRIKSYFRSTSTFEGYRKREREEAAHIFQYLLEGIDQKERPITGTVLRIFPSD